MLLVGPMDRAATAVSRTPGVQKGRVFNEKSLTRQGEETNVDMAREEEDGVVLRRDLEWRTRTSAVRVADRGGSRVRQFPRGAAQPEAGPAHRGPGDNANDVRASNRPLSGREST